MRNETISQATYRYRLWKDGKRIDTGTTIYKETDAVAMARIRLSKNLGFTATIEKRDAEKSRYDVLYEIN